MTDWDSHQERIFWEEYDFLREQGESDESIARRFDIAMSTLRKRQERRRTP